MYDKNAPTYAPCEACGPDNLKRVSPRYGIRFCMSHERIRREQATRERDARARAAAIAREKAEALLNKEKTS